MPYFISHLLLANYMEYNMHILFQWTLIWWTTIVDFFLAVTTMATYSTTAFIYIKIPISRDLCRIDGMQHIVLLLSIQIWCYATDPSSRQYVGCFRYKDTDPALVHHGGSRGTIDECLEYCRRQGYTFAGIRVSHIKNHL